MTKLTSLSLCTLLVTLGIGCTDKNGKGPQTADSSSQPVYAMRYPEKVERSGDTAKKHEDTARAEMGKFKDYPEQLKDPDWTLVEKVVEAAEQDGKSSAYDDEAELQAQVQEFMDDEREPIVKKIGGGAQYAVKQAGCTADVYGPISSGLKDAVDDRFKERRQQRGTAHMIIERNQEKLGKKNIPALSDQASDVADASWRVHVGMPRERQRLTDLVAQSSRVRTTMKDFIEEEKKLQAEPGRTPDEINDSKARVTAMERSLATLDASEQQYQEGLKTFGEREKALKKEYDEAIEALRKSLRTKISETAKA